MPEVGAAPGRGLLEPGSMSLLQHLEELRQRIIWSLVAVGAGFGVVFWYADKVYKLMQVPVITALHMNKIDAKLVYLSPTEPFNIAMKIGMIGGLFVASPFVLWQVWQFISPGLYRHEKKWIMPFLFSTVGLFLSGGIFGYYMVYPAALNFLIDYGTQLGLAPMITASEYTNLFLTIIIGMGIIFEMPILVFFLALFGIVDAGFLWRNLRYSIFIIFVIAAIVTPTTDALNMCIFAAPMCVLYVLSIGIAWLVHPKRRKKRSEASAEA